jgi:transcriptional antiterminator NusG
VSDITDNASEPLQDQSTAAGGDAPAVGGPADGGPASGAAASLPPDDTAPAAAHAVSGHSEAFAGDAGPAEDEEPFDPKLHVPGAFADTREDVAPLEEIKPSDDAPNKNWYILKVQSNREETIRDALQRRVAMAGLDKFFGDIIVPIEMVSEFKGGKKRVVKRKLYPGYLVVHMEINDDTWYLVRDTLGIGDFTGAGGKPTPMASADIARIVAKKDEKHDEAPKLVIKFNKGDRVKINEGTFENFEGEVEGIDEANGRVTVMINIFGRSTPVELEYGQIEAV